MSSVNKSCVKCMSSVNKSLQVSYKSRSYGAFQSTKFQPDRPKFPKTTVTVRLKRTFTVVFGDSGVLADRAEIWGDNGQRAGDPGKKKTNLYRENPERWEN